MNDELMQPLKPPPPDMERALSELRELTALVEAGDLDAINAFNEVVNGGTPLLQIDDAATAAAGNRVVVYKLAERLRVRLATTRARNVEVDRVS